MAIQKITHGQWTDLDVTEGSTYAIQSVIGTDTFRFTTENSPSSPLDGISVSGMTDLKIKAGSNNKVYADRDIDLSVQEVV
mgnify:CR=1 FL=1